jgi:hypothetical protein
VTLWIFPPKINKPPVFSPFLEPAYIEITGADDEKFEIKFPATKDAEGTKVTLEVLPPLPSFVKFKDGDNKLTLTAPFKLGDYQIDVKLTDQDLESTSWKQKIFVTKKEKEVAEEKIEK